MGSDHEGVRCVKRRSGGSGASCDMRVRSFLTGLNHAILTIFLGTQIPSLLMMVEGNETMPFVSLPMLMDRMDMRGKELSSKHWFVMFLSTFENKSTCGSKQCCH